MDINKIAFTGSTHTGRLIAIAAAKSNLKRVSLELGGKSANIIFPSADLEQAIAWTALGVFENGGQSCTAGSRVLVHESILEEFTAGIKAAAEKILVRTHPSGDTTLMRRRWEIPLRTRRGRAPPSPRCSSTA